MKSIKPGRGPSMQSGIASIFAMIFGVIWCLGAAKIGAPMPFVLFGVVFIIAAGIQAYVGFHNATSENRWSSYDITDDGEEVDPLEERYGRKAGEALAQKEETQETQAAYCPYCGAKAKKDYVFCRKCGRKL